MNANPASTLHCRHDMTCIAEAGSRFTQNFSRLLASAGCAAFLLVSATALAQVAPPASTWQQFGALSAAGLSGQAAPGPGAVINGSVGSNTAISNFPPSSVLPGFLVFPVADPIVGTAITNANNAYNFLLLQGPGTVLPDNLATIGGPLTSGVYSTTTGAADLPALSVLTLNGPGIFVFNVASLTMNVGSSVAGTANPCNIYWRVTSSATLNGNNFRGIVIALASVTVGDIVGPLLGTNLQGSAVGLTGSVTMAGDGGTTIGGCSVSAAAQSGAATPTLSEWAMVMLAAILAAAGFAAMRRQAR